MKSSKKVLALALAAAMVVTAVPATNAEAASTAKLSATKATVYVGSSKTLTVKTPSNWKSVKTTVKSSAKSIAKVSKTSTKKVKVTAVKAGKAKVTVKVTAKKNGKKVSKTLTSNITVKNYKVRLVDANNATVSGTAIAVVGTPVQFTAKTAPAKAAVTYTSSDETIATVDQTGKVTPVKAGKVTITAATDKATTSVEVEVKNYIFESVKQTRYNQVVATVKGNLDTLKKTDFKIWNDYSTNVHPVKDMTVDKKTSTVTLTTYYEGMTDGKTYNVELGDTTQKFVATNGVIDHLGVTPTTIAPKTEQIMSAVFYDVNNVIVKPEQKYNAGVRTNDLDFTIATTNGYTTTNALQLYKAGDTATATLELHSNKYDPNGNEIGNVKNTVTITAADPEAVKNESFSIKTGDKGKSFDTVTPTVVAQGDENKAAYVQIKLSNGKTTSNLSNYTVESSDLNVVILNNQQGPSDGQIALVPVRTGTCNIIIRDKENKTVLATLPVEVKAARYAASLSLTQYSTTLSNKVQDVQTNEFVKDSATTTAKVSDQYNETYTKGVFGYETKSRDGKTVDNNGAKVISGSAISNGTITVETVKAEDKDTVTTQKGTYVGTVTFTDDVNGKTLSKTFTTSVQEPDADYVDSYRMVLDKTDVDAVITATATTNSAVSADVYGYVKGIKRKVYTSYITANNGWTLTKGSTSITKDAANVNVDNNIDVNNINAGDRFATGTYSLTATFNITASDVNDKDVNVDTTKKKVITSNFTVKDSQAAPTLKLYNDGKIDEKATIDNILEAKYTGGSCVIGTIKTNDKNVTTIPTLMNGIKAGTSYMIYDVNVTTTFNQANANGHHNVVKSTVTLNHTVSKDGNW